MKKSMIFLVIFMTSNSWAEWVSNPPGSQRNGMHSCSFQAMVVGVHIDNNQLICTAAGQVSDSWLGSEIADYGISGTNQMSLPDGTSFHICPPNHVVTGVHADKNGFNCAPFAAGLIGAMMFDMSPINAGGTQRSGMHACPLGFVLLGAHFGKNIFFCGKLPFCSGNDQCPSGSECVFRSVGAGDDRLIRIRGTCR